MEELTEIEELRAKLAKCRADADNHRRSRDYHKEANADLRAKIEVAKNQKDFWEKSLFEMEEAKWSYIRKYETWRTIATVFIVFSIAISGFLFFCLNSQL